MLRLRLGTFRGWECLDAAIDLETLAQTANIMSSAALVSARKSRSMLFYRIVLPTIVSSSAVVSAYTNLHHTQIRSLHPSAAHSNVLPFGPRRRHSSNEYPRQILRYDRSLAKSRNSANSNNATTTSLTTSDVQHMKLAVRLARIGYGNTFPNPAVGCVLVSHGDDSSSIIGSGFHPKAGMPHAEVFALLEACGHVDDGVEAARSVMEVSNNSENMTKQVVDLLSVYKSPDGASELFKDHFADSNVTAYVTLEPCCHVGQTPPCALSLVVAGINRVVVGFRDPNPRVDGGGIQLLKDAGIDVHVMGASSNSEEEVESAQECTKLVEYFVKRISPDSPVNVYDDMNGKKRMVLRAIAGRQKTAGTMPEVEWAHDKRVSQEDSKDMQFLQQVDIDSRFLEKIDEKLWQHEVVLLRLKNVVSKKKGAKIIGERVGEILNAHLAQVLGHTALLYRPALPSILDLDEMVRIESEESE